MTAAPKKLKKNLGLFDVFAICTGAMFSSGFFLLPGLAAAQTGPSVALAYLIAGILMLPAMFSMAELSTAMPRAGGDYYFLDRALGPLVGTIGGIGTYLALSLKSAFALIGMGAYLTIFFDVPIKPLAVGLTVVFMGINIFGAKETTALQRILIVILLSVLAFFIVGGLFAVGTDSTGTGEALQGEFSPFFTDGIAGLLGTVGFVFVSYAGLTKIASVSEEIVNPGRNIPLGMILSIIVTTFIYVVGILIMLAVLPPQDFQADLTPVATAADEIFSLPASLGVALIVASAVAAFASTGNAGILAASRYPLAMGRDKLIPKRFSTIGQFQTPTFSILVTSGLMIAAIVLLNEEDIAKIASTFQLLIFMLVNFSVIVMRESRIEFYDPIYRTPLYPFTQIFGILASILLITYLGPQAILMTVAVITLSVAWYFYYADKNVARHGAIYHWFAQLGQRAYSGLESELRDIMREKGVREEDPFDEVVTRAIVLEKRDNTTFEQITSEVVRTISQKYPMVEEKLAQELLTIHDDDVLMAQGAALPNVRLKEIDHTELVMIRVHQGIHIPLTGTDAVPSEQNQFFALFFLISPENNPTRHLRILAQLTEHIDYPDFAHDWRYAVDQQELKEIMLHSERLLTLWVKENTRTHRMVNKMMRELDMPKGSLVAFIRRGDNVIIPSGETTIQLGDRLTIIGEPEQIDNLYHQYVGEQSTPSDESTLT